MKLERRIIRFREIRYNSPITTYQNAEARLRDLAAIVTFHPVKSTIKPMSRLEQIREMLGDDPDDVFLNYALALELDKNGDHEQSLELFRNLTAGDAPYVPAFFMAAQMLNRLGRIAEAREFLESGIGEARNQGHDHATAEMTEYLEMLGEL